MPPFITKIVGWLFGNPTYLIMGVMVATIGFLNLQVTEKNKQLKNADQAIQVYQHNIFTLDQALVSTDKITLQDSKMIEEDNKAENLIQLGIEKANEKDDAPVAPVLRNAIDSLYGPANAKASDKHKTSLFHHHL